MNPLIQLKRISSVCFVAVVLACFALSTAARAACQQGCDLSNANTFLGDSALSSNTIGFQNTAIGAFALSSNTEGGQNTAVGEAALQDNIIGGANTAIGFAALLVNNGPANTAVGFGALEVNFTGKQNTATGVNALTSDNTGDNNTAEGFDALRSNTGSNNIAVGANAGLNLTTGSNNIDIGALGVVGESNTIRIGTIGTQRTTVVAGIFGAIVPPGVGVIVGPGGHLGTTTSSARFKDSIKPMDNASETILALKPVTFRYKKDLDPDGIPQFGLVAEEVEKVNPDLVARDGEGKPYTVRYEAVNAMLLNEFLKEHKRVEEQQATIAELKGNAARQEKISAQQQKQIDALTAVVQKVSAQLELSKAAPQTVVNNR
jgi:hypothetical protein